MSYFCRGYESSRQTCEDHGIRHAGDVAWM